MATRVFGLYDHIEKVQARLRPVSHVVAGLDPDAFPTQCILDFVAQYPLIDPLQRGTLGKLHPGIDRKASQTGKRRTLSLGLSLGDQIGHQPKRKSQGYKRASHTEYRLLRDSSELVRCAGFSKRYEPREEGPFSVATPRPTAGSHVEQLAHHRRRAAGGVGGLLEGTTVYDR